MADDKDKELARPALPADAYEREATTDLKDTTPDKPKGMPLHTRILIGLALGVVAGVAVNALRGDRDPGVEWFVSNFTEPVGTLFLRLLLMIVVPLVFSSLVVGVAGIGDIRKLGRVGLKSFAYCLIISAISVVIGLTLANTIKPGRRIDPATSQALQQRYGEAASKQVGAAQTAATNQDKPLMSVVKTIVPANPVAAAAGLATGATTQNDTPNMLHLMFFALLVGVAITLLPIEVTAPLLRIFEV